MRASTITGVKELQREAKTQRPVLKANWKATVETDMASTSRATMVSIGYCFLWSFQNCKISNVSSFCSHSSHKYLSISLSRVPFSFLYFIPKSWFTSNTTSLEGRLEAKGVLTQLDPFIFVGNVRTYLNAKTLPGFHLLSATHQHCGS